MIIIHVNISKDEESVIHLAIANHVKAKLAENGIVPSSKVAKVKAKGM